MLNSNTWKYLDVFPVIHLFDVMHWECLLIDFNGISTCLGLFYA